MKMIKHSDCKCHCHVSGGMHIVACCEPDGHFTDMLKKLATTPDYEGAIDEIKILIMGEEGDWVDEINVILDKYDC